MASSGKPELQTGESIRHRWWIRFVVVPIVLAVLGFFVGYVSRGSTPPTPQEVKIEFQYPSVPGQPVKSGQVAGDDSEPNCDSGSEAPDLATRRGRYINRKCEYNRTRYVELVHILAPSDEDNKNYNIFIYLVRHKPRDQRDGALVDVQKAEFFFGPMWGNQIFHAKRHGDKLGITISAYGPLLCTCRITFDDGVQRMLYRYIDFEMANAIRRE